GSFFSAPGTSDVDEPGLEDRVKDLVFVLNALEEWNRNDVFLAGRLDLSKVAAMGFSYGAATADEFCRIDGRCLAAVSLDGFVDLFAPALLLRQVGLQKPLIMLNNPSNSSNEMFAKAKTDAVWFQLSSTTHFSFSSWQWAISSSSSGIESERAVTRTILAYTASFLHKSLTSQDDHLLD